MINSHELESKVASTSWFEAEAITTGHVSLLYSSPGSRLRHNADFDFHVFDHQMTFDYFGPVNVIRGGICGAPIIHQPTTDNDLSGALVGFYSLTTGRRTIVPSPDRFMDDGWRLAIDS